MALPETLDPMAARELVQARLLGALFSKSVRREIVLKGGLAMRIMAHSNRFTRDIDLAATDAVPAASVRAAIRAAIADLKGAGILANFRVSEPKQTETTLRWKIGGEIGGTGVNLTVEVSRRPGLPTDHVQTATWRPPAEYDAGAIPVDTIDLQALAASKAACLGDRVREATRDVYDLNVLITMDIEPPIALLRRFPRETLVAWREAIWDKLDKMTFEEAETTLLPTLPHAVRSRIGAEEWDMMRIRVGHHVDLWVDQALDDEPLPSGPDTVKAS